MTNEVKKEEVKKPLSDKEQKREEFIKNLNKK